MQQEEKDIERIENWLAFCSMPGEDNPTLEAIGRVFPRMLAALRFVQNESELLGMALSSLECQPSVSESLQAECRSALRKVAEFRR